MIKVKGEVRPQSPDTEYMYISIMVRLSIKAWPLLAELSQADVESWVSMMLQKIYCVACIIPGKGGCPYNSWCFRIKHKMSKGAENRFRTKFDDLNCKII